MADSLLHQACELYKRAVIFFSESADPFEVFANHSGPDDRPTVLHQRRHDPFRIELQVGCSARLSQRVVAGFRGTPPVPLNC